MKSFSFIVYSNKLGARSKSNYALRIFSRGNGSLVDINGIKAIIYNAFIIFHNDPNSPVAAPLIIPAAALACEDAEAVLPTVSAISTTSDGISSSSVTS